jgi:arylsulfatase A-like enzyme
MPSVVALPLQCDRLWSGVRSSTQKLILNSDGSPWLYFDLKNDPWELTNLAGDRSRIAEIDALRSLI